MCRFQASVWSWLHYYDSLSFKCIRPYKMCWRMWVFYSSTQPSPFLPYHLLSYIQRKLLGSQLADFISFRVKRILQIYFTYSHFLLQLSITFVIFWFNAKTLFIVKIAFSIIRYKFISYYSPRRHMLSDIIYIQDWSVIEQVLFGVASTVESRLIRICPNVYLEWKYPFEHLIIIQTI